MLITGTPGQSLAFRGAWSSGDTAYVPFDIVSSRGSTYECILAATNRSALPCVDTVYWTLISRGFNWIGAWVTSTHYYPYDVVSNAGVTYVCILEITSSTTIPASDGTYFSVLTGATIDTTASDIAMNGVRAAGSVGLAADAGHVHASDTGLQAVNAKLTSLSAVESNLGSISGTVAINWATANTFYGTLTDAMTVTFTFSNPQVGQTIRVRLTQGASGSHLAIWPTLLTAGATGIVLSTAEAAEDIVTITCVTGPAYRASIERAFA